MAPRADGRNGQAPEGAGRALEIAIAHLQVQLASIAGFDGKLMFLTALNVAGISALVGIAASADPSLWLLGVGLASSTICAQLGLGNLWAWHVPQFPAPAEAMRAALENRLGNTALAWEHLQAIALASTEAEAIVARKSRLMRSLLVGTPISLGVVVATALTTAL